MINRIAQYNAILEGQEEFQMEKIASGYKEYSVDLEMFEKSIKADIHYLGKSLMEGKCSWPRLLEALEKKVGGYSELVDDCLKQQYLDKIRNNRM